MKGYSSFCLLASDAFRTFPQQAKSLVFCYYIAPRGESETDALVQRTLSAPNLDAARRYAQTVNPPTIKGRRDLEVILTDDKGKEVWRGPYTGPGG